MYPDRSGEPSACRRAGHPARRNAGTALKFVVKFERIPRAAIPWFLRGPLALLTLLVTVNFLPFQLLAQASPAEPAGTHHLWKPVPDEVFEQEIGRKSSLKIQLRP